MVLHYLPSPPGINLKISDATVFVPLPRTVPYSVLDRQVANEHQQTVSVVNNHLDGIAA